LKSTGAASSFVHRQIRQRQIELIDDNTFQSTRIADVGARVAEGQTLRISERFFDSSSNVRGSTAIAPLSEEEINFMQSLVIYKDEHIVAINKPVGLSMQAGARVRQHVDRLLPALTFDAADKPRIVHRLDKDTSGVVLLARSMRAAKSLSAMLSPAKKDDGVDKIQKTYVAFCYNVPARKSGRISNFLTRQQFGDNSDRIVVADHVKHGGANRPGDSLKVFRAVTEYETLVDLSQFSVLKLMPHTGRQHQLRVHCAVSLQCPIVGDTKYTLNALPMSAAQNKRESDVNRPKRSLRAADVRSVQRISSLLECRDEDVQMHLHAAKVVIPRLSTSDAARSNAAPWERSRAKTPTSGDVIVIHAPLSSVMRKTFSALGISEKELQL